MYVKALREFVSNRLIKKHWTNQKTIRWSTKNLSTPVTFFARAPTENVTKRLLIISSPLKLSLKNIVSLWDDSFSTYAKFSENMCVSGSKKCWLFGKFYVRTKWMTPLVSVHDRFQKRLARTSAIKKIT